MSEIELGLIGIACIFTFNLMVVWFITSIKVKLTKCIKWFISTKVDR